MDLGFTGQAFDRTRDVPKLHILRKKEAVFSSPAPDENRGSNARMPVNIFRNRGIRLPARRPLVGATSGRIWVMLVVKVRTRLQTGSPAPPTIRLSARAGPKSKSPDGVDQAGAADLQRTCVG